MTYKLDKKDTKILYELDINARQSNSQIGKKVKLSKEVVQYRIKRLEEKGIILRYSTLIDMFKVGMRKYKLYLRLRGATKEKQEEIAQYFYKHKKTEWVIICSGRWDLIANYWVRDVNEFDEEIQIVINKYSQYIQEKATITTLQISHATREYLKENTNEQKKYIEYKIAEKTKTLDEVDKEILKIIANNARLSVVQIAKIIKTTPRIIRYRIKELEKKKIILGYKVTLDPKKLGKIFFKAIFYVTNITTKKLNEFMNHIHNIKQAIWPQRVLAPWDVELDMETTGYEEFNNIITEIKANFSDIILNTEFVIISKEYKLDFYPGCYKKIK
ncbi:Lrp/AsnC family transcriptional regulator [Candidatus Woesearchaeota archaeon]|nr:Lrp/AsnC family transcriptional regulator [Candidatus Woesearchaeota archaeon]